MPPKLYLILKEKAAAFVTLSIIQFFLNAGFILWFIIIHNEGAAGYLIGSVMGQVVLLPVFLVISFITINLWFKVSIIKNAISFSAPILPAIISGWVLNLSDRIFIEHYFTLEDVGIYSLGYKIAGIIVLFGGAMSMAYKPVFF